MSIMKLVILKVIVLGIYIALLQNVNAAEKGFDQLVMELTSPCADERMDAAWALGELKDTRAVKYLVKSLEDPDECVRYYAVKALGNLGDNSSIPFLEKALNREVQPWIVQVLKEAIDKLNKH